MCSILTLCTIYEFVFFSISQGRSFDNRIVDVKFYPEDAFRSMNYTVSLPPIVVTASYGATALDKIFTPAALSKIALEDGL